MINMVFDFVANNEQDEKKKTEHFETTKEYNIHFIDISRFSAQNVECKMFFKMVEKDMKNYFP